MPTRRTPAGSEKVAVTGPVASTGEIAREPPPPPLAEKLEAAKTAHASAGYPPPPDDDDPDAGYGEDPGTAARYRDLAEQAQRPVLQWTNVRTSNTAYPPPGLGVVRAIVNTMANVSAVPKTGTAQANQGGYKYRSIDDVMDVLHGALVKAGLVVIPSMIDWEELPYVNSRGETQPWWRRVRVTMRYTFVAAEDGSTWTCEFTAVGDDNSDKGTGKAASYAFKLMASEVFALQFGDPAIDNEHASNSQARERDEQRPPARQPAQQPPPTPKRKWDAEEWQRQMAARGVSIGAMEARLREMYGDGAPFLTSAAAILTLEPPQRSQLGNWLTSLPEVPPGEPWTEPPTVPSPTTYGDNSNVAWAQRGREVRDAYLPDDDRATVAAARRAEVEADVAAVRAARGDDYEEEDWEEIRSEAEEDDE